MTGSNRPPNRLAPAHPGTLDVTEAGGDELLHSERGPALDAWRNGSLARFDPAQVDVERCILEVLLVLVTAQAREWNVPTWPGFNVSKTALCGIDETPVVSI